MRAAHDAMIDRESLGINHDIQVEGLLRFIVSLINDDSLGDVS